MTNCNVTIITDLGVGGVFRFANKFEHRWGRGFPITYVVDRDGTRMLTILEQHAENVGTPQGVEDLYFTAEYPMTQSGDDQLDYVGPNEVYKYTSRTFGDLWPEKDSVVIRCRPIVTNYEFNSRRMSRYNFSRIPIDNGGRQQDVPTEQLHTLWEERDGNLV